MTIKIRLAKTGETQAIFRDWVEFKRDFGYTKDAEAKHAYYACEKQYNRLHRLFNQDEIDILSTIE